MTGWEPRSDKKRPHTHGSTITDEAGFANNARQTYISGPPQGRDVTVVPIPTYEYVLIPRDQLQACNRQQVSYRALSSKVSIR